MGILDIIVTHYNEPWSVVRPFFDMLNCQRGVNFNDFRVILVHDGGKAFPEEYFRDGLCAVQQIVIEHAGVSAARNAGLKLATAKWVNFCDCDDRYTNIYSLREVMSCMNRDADYMWTPFIIENVKNDDLTANTREENIVWIHGKYFRREWLLENEIFFPENIHFSEDSVFCSIVNELAQPMRRGKIRTDFPVYSWVYRDDSVTTDPKNEYKNTMEFLERNFCVVEEFRKRKLNHVPMVGRMFTDAYIIFHQRDRKFAEEEARFSKRAKEYLPDLEKNDTETMRKIMSASKKGFMSAQMDDSEWFGDWVRRIAG